MVFNISCGAPIFLPQFLFEWNAVQTISLDHTIFSICWNMDGSRLLTGGVCLTLWEDHTPIFEVEKLASAGAVEEEEEESEEEEEEEEERKRDVLEVAWKCRMAAPLSHCKFSPCGSFFASCGKVC